MNQCLPLPSRRHKKQRKRKRQDNHNTNQVSNHHDVSSDSTAFTASISGRSIADLSQMSALEYLGMVHDEGRDLGEVFVADRSDQNQSQSASVVGSGQEKEAEKEEEVEEGEVVTETTPPKSKLKESDASSVGGIAKSTARKSKLGSGSGSAYAASYLLSSRTSLPSPPTLHHIPPTSRPSSSSSNNSQPISHAWIHQTLDNFSRMRLYLDACYEGSIGGKTAAAALYRVPVPPMKARGEWHQFCLGDDESSGNIGGYYQDDDDANVSTSKDKKDIEQQQAPSWRQNLPLTGHPPTTALLLQMDQVMTRRVLAHHIHFVTHGQYDLTANRCRWIYALLGRLAKPIHRDDAASLRELLRELCVRRARLEIMEEESVGGGLPKEKEELARLNMLIAIVGVYFEQGGSIEALFTVGGTT